MSPPIVTLTLNPAVDLNCMAEGVVPSHKNRTFGEQLDPGGGGINVARAIHLLGGNALALIMTGGITGHLLEELLNEEGVAWQSLPIRGRNRISLNVHDQTTGLEWRFVPAGPSVDTTEWCAALSALEQIKAEWVVASGSLPPGAPPNFYAHAASIARRRGQKFVLDTSGIALTAIQGHGIEVLKLSLREFESLVGHATPDAGSQDAQIAALIRSETAQKIAVTLGEDGALLGTKEGINRLPAIKVQTRGAVGAGDSFLAGLVLGLERGLSDRQALAFGNAAGAAAVATYGTVRIQRADVEALYRDWCRD